MSFSNLRLVRQEYNRQKGTFTGSKTYHIDSDSLDDDAVDAESVVGLPAIGEPYKAGSTAKCISRKASNFSDDQLTYEIACEFSSERSAQDQTIENPLARPPKYNYAGSTVAEPVFFDSSPQPTDWDEEANGPWQGKPIVNSALELLPEQPQRERPVGTITITRNEAVYDDLIAESFKGTVNKSDVTIRGITYAAGTLRMGNISADGPNVENEITFWSVTYEIAKNIKGHKLAMEDRGYHELVQHPDYPNDPFKRIHRRIVLREGIPIHPYPLDGQGHAKSDPAEQPAVLVFKPDPEIEWGPLNLV